MDVIRFHSPCSHPFVSVRKKTRFSCSSGLIKSVFQKKTSRIKRKSSELVGKHVSYRVAYRVGNDIKKAKKEGNPWKKEKTPAKQTHLGVTDPLRNSCRKSCLMASSQAACGATSQMKPRKRLLPQKRSIAASVTFRVRNTLVTTVELRKKFPFMNNYQSLQLFPDKNHQII